MYIVLEEKQNLWGPDTEHLDLWLTNKNRGPAKYNPEDFDLVVKGKVAAAIEGNVLKAFESEEDALTYISTINSKKPQWLNFAYKKVAAMLRLPEEKITNMVGRMNAANIFIIPLKKRDREKKTDYLFLLTELEKEGLNRSILIKLFEETRDRILREAIQKASSGASLMSGYYDMIKRSEIEEDQEVSLEVDINVEKVEKKE